MKKENDYTTDENKSTHWSIIASVLAVVAAVALMAYFGGLYDYFTGEDELGIPSLNVDSLATEQFKKARLIQNLDFKDAAVTSVKDFYAVPSVFVRDSIAVKQALRQKQIEASTKVDIANAERIVMRARHKVILENEHMHMERAKLQALAHAKQTMYEGLIKKLDEQANDETLSFNHLLKKYEEQ